MSDGTTPRDRSAIAEPPRANMRFGMPASYEDMLELGLNPYTGEPLPCVDCPCRKVVV